MAVPAAVALVRQIQSIVENPELLRKNDCIDQVSSFLDCFLDHPDSRARLGAARALAQLAKSLSSKELGCLQLRQAPRILARLRSAEQRSRADADDKDLHSLLASVLEGAESQESHGSSGAVRGDSACSLLRPAGEVVRLRARVPMDEQTRTAVRQALVRVGGVVSVTFEALETIVVGARTLQLARDPVFVEDLCTNVEEQLLRCGGLERGKVLVAPEVPRTGLALLVDQDSVCSSEDEPEYIDDDDEDGTAGTVHVGSSCATSQKHVDTNHESSSRLPEDCDDDDDEPTYLDDSEDEAPKPGQARSIPASLTTWSFFSAPGATGFFTAQRLKEYQDDPTLVARLHRAQTRLARRRQEEQTRLQRVLSVITPLRTHACSEAAKRGAVAFHEEAGVE